MRTTIASILLFAAAVSAEDGGVAPPERWSHPRGPASCNGHGAARPPESLGGVVWSHKAKEEIAAPPLTWDGVVFLLEGRTLVALDAMTGEAWARIETKATGDPAGSGRSVYLIEGGDTLVQYQLAGRSLDRGWTIATGAGSSPPRILAGEIYVATPQALLSVRSGEQDPVWKAPGRFVGKPAVRGDHVYAVRRDEGKLFLAAYARKDGSEAASDLVARIAPDGEDAQVALGGNIAAVHLPGGHDWVLVRRKAGDGKLELEAGRKATFLTPPFVGTNVVVAITEKPHAMSLLRFAGKHATRPAVRAKARPDLFEGVAGCVWLGESSQGLGPWFGDVNGNRIFWHLDQHPETRKLFQKGVRFHAVPARHEHLLLVPADGKSLHLIGPEHIE